MPNTKCFVPGCKTNYSSDIKERKSKGERNLSVFRAPKESGLLEKWQKAIPRADKVLSNVHYICELHFVEDEIERNYITKLPDGTTHVMERGRPLLKKGAIPSVFPNLPKYLTKQSKKRPPPTERSCTVKDYKKVQFCQVDELAQVSENGDGIRVETEDYYTCCASIIKGKCFVPGCRTNYASDVKERKSKGERNPSVFVAPKDPALLEKWQRAIPRADKVLSRTDVVCDLHFLKDEVERNYITKLRDGTVHVMERGSPALKKGAVPSIFPNLSKCDTREKQHRKQLTEHSCTEEDYKKVKFCQVKAIKLDGHVEVPKNRDGNGHENNNVSISDRNGHENNNVSISDRNGHETNNCSFSDRNGHETNNFSLSDRNGHETNNFPFSYRNGHQTNNISSDINADEANDFSSDRSRSATNNFSFSDLIQNLGSIQKPSKWWAITEHGNFLICVKWGDGFKAEKKIILDDDLKFQVYVYDCQIFNVQPQNLNSLGDVSALLKTVNSCICCASIAKGYKEPNCEILIKKSENGRPRIWCKSCNGKKRTTDDQSPKKSGRKETITRKQLYQQFIDANKKVLRLRKKVKSMQQKIDDLQKELKNKKMEALQNELKSKNIAKTPRKFSSVFLDS